MKKLWIIPVLGLLLVGCCEQNTLETVTDVHVSPAMATVQQVFVSLPGELSTPVFQDKQAGSLYLCDDYSVSMQTTEAGDLQKTIFSVCGQQKEALQIMKTEQPDYTRYEFVWTSNSESGLQVGRCCILDDGNYHYVITAVADEEVSGNIKEVWNEIFHSACLVSGEVQLNTGS